jgi:hypothetical protein
MTYRFRCNTCNNIFTSDKQSAVCTRHGHRDHSSTFLGEVIDTAVDVAFAYAGVSAVIEVADAVGDFVGSLFD